MKNSIFRKSLSTVLAVMMILSAFSGITVFAEREYSADISICGITVDFENEPYSKFDTIFIPLEEMAGYIGLDLTREGNAYTIKRMRDTLTMEINNIVCTVNGKTILLKNALIERDGVIYAPIEIFSEGLKCPVTVSDDFRSADLQTNVYTITFTEQTAAAISAALPDKDTLATGETDADMLFYKPSESPEKTIAAYYQADFSDFSGMDISMVTLEMHVARGSNLNQAIHARRTKPWDKATINFNNMPEEYSDQEASKQIPSELKQSAKNWGDMNIDVTKLAKNAIADGEKLSLMMLGVPYRNQQNPGSPQAHIKGVNTTTPPYLSITVDESYSFPVKKAETAISSDSKFSELQLLRSMGVFTEADEFPLDMNESVTRAEFLTYAMRLRGTDVPSGQAEPFFSDVPADSTYYQTVQSAQALGYIVGWQGIAFRPYDAITMGEAVTILGRMLNYSIYAEERGGFTPGYFAAAKLGDLYLGVNDNTSLVSFNKMIDLLENALDAKMMDVISYSSDGKADYIFNENMTILTEYWDAQKIEGVVTANEYGNITPGVNGEEGYIQIGGKRLKLNYEPYNQYLGYKVKGYYSRTEDVLLYIGTVVSGNVTEVKLADVEAVSETSSTVSFSYMKRNKNRANESFSKNATVIYNGKSVAANNVTAELLQADSGDITLVGSDLVIINAYRTVVVFGTDLNEEIIYDLYEEYDNTVRLKNKDWTIKDTDGKKLELTDLQKYDVISVAESADGEYVTGIVEKKTVSGTITLIENGGTVDEILTINGIEYETANRNEDWTKLVMLGADGKFFIDSEGSVVGFIPTQTTDVLGYVVTMDYSRESSLRNNLQAAIMVQGNEDYVLYEFADKVEIDGVKFDDADEIKDYLSVDVYEVDENGNKVLDPDTNQPIVIGREIEPQGIIFTLNSDKKISIIDTYKLGDDEDEDNSLRRMANRDEELRVKSSGKFGDKFFWSYSTALMVVSTDNTNSVDSYMTITGGISNDEKIWPEVYTMGKNNPDAAIVALRNYTPGAGVGGNYLVVDKIVTAYDEEGYEVKKLYYHSAPGTIKTVIVPDDKLDLLLPYEEIRDNDGELVDTNGNAKAVNGVSRGDIIMIGTDAKGELSALTEYFDYQEKVLTNLNTSFTAQDRYYGGYTTLVNGTNIKVAPNLDTMDTNYYWVKNSEITNFYRYEVNNAGVELFNATLNDVRPYDMVPYNPTGMLLKATYARIEGTNFLLDMNQPEGTGIYTLSYEPNLPAGTTEGDLGGFENIETVRYNPGDIAAAEEKGSITLKEYEFIGWKIKGTGETVAPGGDVFMNGNVVLQAQWTPNPTITFNFTDADNPQMSFTADYNQYSFVTGSQQQVYQQLPTGAAGFEKAGHVLVGWEGEDGTRYMLNNTVDPDSELYAVPAQSETFKAIWMQKWSGSAATDAPSATVIDGQTYYQIKNGEDLAKFAAIVNGGESGANAILMNDIYLNSFLDEEGNIMTTLNNWYDDADKLASAQGLIEGDGANHSIGASSATPFNGIFDGNGKTIHGLYILGSATNKQYALFGNVNGGTIKNLNIADPYVVGLASNASSRQYGVVVSAVPSNGNSTLNITNVNVIRGKYTSGGSSAHMTYFGSILTYATTTATQTINITGCTSSITFDASGAQAFTAVNTNTGIGGIVGRAKAGDGDITIDGCSFTGHIILNSSSTAKFGGIIGRGTDSSGKKAHCIVKNCTGTFTVENAAYANAICGIGSNYTGSDNSVTSTVKTTLSTE